MKETLLLNQITYTPEETYQCGVDFASKVNNGDFIALFGDLGAGKTHFIKGIASVLTPAAHVQSPTYSIVKTYQGPNVTLCHFDMYRITSEDDLISCGFFDYENCIIATEWSENIEYALPSSYYRVNIQKDDTASNTRMLTISLIQQEA